MGGDGSGRRGYRPVVEHSFTLDSYSLQRERIMTIHGSGCIFGSLKLRYFSIDYSINYACQTITLSYTKTKLGEKYSINDTIQFTTQKTNFGGSRFLFICPNCYTRAAKLYMPNFSFHFQCRRCHNLTYQSCNESGYSLLRHVASNEGISFEEVKNILKRKW